MNEENNKITFKTLFGLVIIFMSGCGNDNWHSRLKSVLPEFGHRNWIVVADSAYPKQSAQGIETICTSEGQIAVLKTVLSELENAKHVQPVVLIDEELERVPENDAPGVAAYRNELNELLKSKQLRVMPHENIIAELDKSSKMFNVLILKTNMTIPYTSVFLQLDCGYWDAEKEKRLRDRLQNN